MKNIIKILGISLLSCLPYIMQGHVTSYTLLKVKTDHGDKEIMLIGDHHKKTQTDKQHCAILENTIEKWAQNSYKTMIMTEMRKDDMALKKSVWSEYLSLDQFSFYLDKVKGKYSNLVIDNTADNRNSYWAVKSLALNNTDEVLPPLNITFAQTIAYIKQYIGEIDNYLKHNAQFAQAINPFKQRADYAHLFFTTLLTTYNPDTYMHSVVNDMLQKSKNKTLSKNDQIILQSLKWYYPNIFAYDQADFGFLTKILSHLKTADRFVLYAGSLHTDHVRLALKRYFDKKLTYIVQIGTVNNNVPLNNDVLTKLLTIDTKEISNKSICFACGTITLQKHTCLTCKEASYCSQICHDADTRKEYHCTNVPTSEPKPISQRTSSILSRLLQNPLLIAGIPIIAAVGIGYGIWKFIHNKRIATNIRAFNQMIIAAKDASVNPQSLNALFKQLEPQLTLLNKQKKQQLRQLITAGDFTACTAFLEKERNTLVAQRNKK